MAAALDHDMKRSGSHDPLIQKYRGSKRKKQQKPQWRSFHNERIINLYRRLFPESLRYGIHLPVTSSSYLQVQKVLLQPVSQSASPTHLKSRENEEHGRIWRELADRRPSLGRFIVIGKNNNDSSPDRSTHTTMSI